MLDLSQNYFELFDLPVGFALDTKRLAERYRTLQAVTHPDRLAHAADHASEDAPEAALRIREAYRTLKDPVSRARYLLRLLTGDADTDGAGSRDADFVMDEMELRETLAEAQSRPNPKAAVAAVLTQLAEESLALDKALEGLFADPCAENLEAAREKVRRLELLDHCRRDAEESRPGPYGRV